MNDNINEYKENKTRNLVLHEGLLLLIYEHFKARTISKQIKDRKEGKKIKGDLDESEEIYLPSDTKEILEMHIDSEDSKTPQYG